MADLNIDWEAMLAEQFGQAPAKAATLIAAQAKEFVQESRGKLHEFARQTVKDDLQVAADKDEVDAFLDNVDNLRADVDRLNARLERLLTKID